jgi:PIN domain nuclease of toxin-antitoxin system
MSEGLLLDTCALIWLMEGEPIKEASLEAIQSAADEDRLHVSLFSAWEVALLHGRSRRSFSAEPRAWFTLAIRRPGLNALPVTATILIDCHSLPGEFHKDPADRIIVATAREFQLKIVTRDQSMLGYAEQGFVEAMNC